MIEVIAAAGIAIGIWAGAAASHTPQTGGAVGATSVAGARVHQDLLTKAWSARWITVQDAQPFGYGVYHFRKTIDLPVSPSSFVVHVSGDNRYQLFVNGRRVVWGPARGDLNHWRFRSTKLTSAIGTLKIDAAIRVIRSKRSSAGVSSMPSA